MFPYQTTNTNYINGIPLMSQNIAGNSFVLGTTPVYPFHQEEKMKDQVIFGRWWSSSRPILRRPHEHWWFKGKWSCSF
jgi:hypothetical protein